jgi:tRNA(Arg) A34 adenosine deaminase TadA
MYNDAFMRRAIEISRGALDTPGNMPYGAVVVKDGKIVGEGLNMSGSAFDPTSHGETEAIRDACKNLQTTDLTGAELYTSCEPCALCVAAMHLANVSKLYYAASLDQSRESLGSARKPLDTVALRAECAERLGGARMAAEQKLDGEAVAVLKAYATKRKAGNV